MSDSTTSAASAGAPRGESERGFADAILALPWGEGRAGDSPVPGIEVVKRSRTRHVLRIADAGAEWGAWQGRTLYAKRYLSKQWRRRLAAMVGASKAKSEARMMLTLAAAGFRLPEVVAIHTARDASYLVTESLPPHRTFASAAAETPAASEERRALWQAAGEFSALFWQRGFCHPDFYEDHLLLVEDVAADAPVADRFALIDVDAVTFTRGRVPAEWARMRSIVQLVKSCPPESGGGDDRRALLRAAFGLESGTPAEEATLAAIQRTARKMGRDLQLG